MAKTENILRVMEELKQTTGVPRTLFAACPNSLSVIKASFRAAKRNNAPIYFATTLYNSFHIIPPANASYPLP